MKPLTSDIQRTGSLGGVEVAMTFDENSIAHIMSVLTDLYSDSEEAIIREYATNAHDSHVAAGQTLPIKVTLPSDLSPYLVIQDFGVGMSKEDIVETYSKYGASTKRDSDEQSGTLGLGCKAGLTYASQFSVTAIKDGIETMVNVSRNQDGTGMMELVSCTMTGEGNGVTISIPVLSPRSVSSKAHKFFSYWKPGTVLINGEEPSLVEGLSLTDNIVLVNNLEHDVVVMGNVPYRISNSHWIAKPASYYKDAGVVAWLPIGSVAFTPNREDLRYTAHTISTLDRIRHQFAIHLNNRANDAIQNCSTGADALSKYLELKSEFGSLQGFNPAKKWHGQSFDKAFISIKHIRFDPDATRYQVQQRVGIEERHVLEGVFITGMPDIALSTHYKNKIRALLDDNNIRHYSTMVYVIKDNAFLSEWFANATQFTWEDVKNTKLANDGPGRSYAGGKQEYKILNDNGWLEDVLDEDIDDSLPIYYGTKADDHSMLEVARFFETEDDQVIFLSRNRWAKFQREHPTALSIYEGRLLKRKQWLDKVPADVLDSLVLSDRDTLRKLNPSAIDDPELVEDIRLANLDCSLWERRFNIYDDYHGKFTRKESVLSKYSLIGWHEITRHHKHLYLYINAVYNSQKDKK